jgi:hypothetical protein
MMEITREWFRLQHNPPPVKTKDLVKLILAGVQILDAFVEDENELIEGFWIDQLDMNSPLIHHISEVEARKQLLTLHCLLVEYLATGGNDENASNSAGDEDVLDEIAVTDQRTCDTHVVKIHCGLQTRIRYAWDRINHAIRAEHDEASHSLSALLQHFFETHRVSVFNGTYETRHCLHVVSADPRIDFIVLESGVLFTVVPVTLAQVRQIEQTGAHHVVNASSRQTLRAHDVSRLESEYVEVLREYMQGSASIDTFCREWISRVVHDVESHSDRFNWFLSKVTDVISASINKEEQRVLAMREMMQHPCSIECISEEEVKRLFRSLRIAFADLFPIDAA